MLFVILVDFVSVFVFWGVFLPERFLEREKWFQTLGKMPFKCVSFLMKEVFECFDQIPLNTLKVFFFFCQFKINS